MNNNENLMDGMNFLRPISLPVSPDDDPKLIDPLVYFAEYNCAGEMVKLPVPERGVVISFEKKATDTDETKMEQPAVPAFVQALHEIQQLERSGALPSESIIQSEVLPAQKQHAPKPMDLAEKLVGMLHFAVWEGQLYLYDERAGYYVAVVRDRVKTLMLRFLETELRVKGTAQQLKDIYEFVRLDPRLEAVSKPLEHLLCFPNGILDLKNKTFSYGQNANYFFTWRLNVPFDPNQTSCPLFDRVLHQMAGGDGILITRILEAMAYLLIPSNHLKHIILFQGVSDSGKSLLANLIASFLDEDTVAHVSATQMQTRFATVHLVGRRLNSCMDLPGGRLNTEAVAFLKQVTGGDKVYVEAKGQDGWSTRLDCRFLFGTNHAFVPAGGDSAFTRRVRLIPFRYAVPPEQVDIHLLERLMVERPAILNRLLMVHEELCRRNFVFTGESIYGMPDLGSYTDQSVPVARFIEECCSLEPGCVTPVRDLFDAYTAFCREHGISGGDNTQLFSRTLNTLTPDNVINKKVRIEGTPMNCYEGIKLLSSEEENACTTTP